MVKGLSWIWVGLTPSSAWNEGYPCRPHVVEVMTHCMTKPESFYLLGSRKVNVSSTKTLYVYSLSCSYYNGRYLVSSST